MDSIKCHIVALIVMAGLLIYNRTNESPAVMIKDPHFVPLGPYNSSYESIDADIYDRLIDIKNFTFTINTFPCSGSEAGILLIVIVASSPKNFENRVVIRNTWGRSTDTTKVVFLVGLSQDANLSAQIRNESEAYADIVQGNFEDAYRNMTYKHVMGLKWVTHHCAQAKYVLKTDDDVVVNRPELWHYLARELSPWGAHGLILCQVLRRAHAQRSHRSKWHVSPAEYAERYYPDYCAGFAVLYSPDVVRSLLLAAQAAPYFWIDDVHLTGVLAERKGIARTPLGSLALSPTRAKLLTSLITSYDVGPFLFGPPDLSAARVTEVWRAISK